jgi:hypothetical protein
VAGVKRRRLSCPGCGKKLTRKEWVVLAACVTCAIARGKLAARWKELEDFTTLEDEEEEDF